MLKFGRRVQRRDTSKGEMISVRCKVQRISQTQHFYYITCYFRAMCFDSF